MKGVREVKSSMKGVRETGSVTRVRTFSPSMSGVREVKPSMNGVYENGGNSERCKRDLEKLMSLYTGNGLSRYTMGEMRRILISERKYSPEIVNECIVDYLENEHLSK